MASCGENGTVGSERDGGGGSSVVVQAREKLPGEMLRISRAAAVAGKQHLPSGRGSLNKPIDDRLRGRQEDGVVERSLDRIAETARDKG